MKRVLTAVVLIPVVLLAVFRAPMWLLLSLIGVVALLATQEYLHLAAKFGARPFSKTVLALTGLVFAAPILITGWDDKFLYLAPLVLLLLVLAPYIFLVMAMRREHLKQTLPSVTFSLLAFPYVALPLLLLAFLRSSRSGWFLVLFVFVAVWTGDIAAYYAGKNLGRRPLAPRISPKKTWEGAVASVITSVLFSVLLSLYAPNLTAGLFRMHVLAEGCAGPVLPPLWIAALQALAINIAAQLGDLVESMLKRGAEVKDSGSILPGHGGVLDRIDALLLASPAAVLVFALTSQYLPFPL